MAANTQRLTVYWARLVFELLEREGLDAEALFEQSGLDVLQLSDPKAYFKQDSFSQLWCLAGQQSGNPTIGLMMGAMPSVNAFDVYSSSIISSSCVREALARAVRYQKIVGSALTLVVDDTPEGCRITFISRGNELPVAREGYDAALSLMTTTLRLITSPPVAPLYVEFCYPEPPDLQPYEMVFNSPLRFGSECYCLCIDASVLELPLVFASESMALQHEKRLADAITALEDASLPDRVRHFIEQKLPGGEPAIQQAAQALNISQRSLQRHLRLEGVSYRALLDEVRKTRARELVVDSEVQLQEITFLLGFSDHSNFYRAFRRWYGTSPGSFR